jgi:hypothetical protein
MQVKQICLLPEMLCDYDYVKQALMNSNNKKQHIPALLQLVINFRKKWNGYAWHEYQYHLHDLWQELDEKLWTEMMEQKIKRNDSKNTRRKV